MGGGRVMSGVWWQGDEWVVTESLADANMVLSGWNVNYDKSCCRGRWRIK